MALNAGKTNDAFLDAMRQELIGTLPRAIVGGIIL
jgi:hypothetical protein